MDGYSSLRRTPKRYLNNTPSSTNPFPSSASLSNLHYPSSSSYRPSSSLGGYSTPSPSPTPSNSSGPLSPSSYTSSHYPLTGSGAGVNYSTGSSGYSSGGSNTYSPGGTLYSSGSSTTPGYSSPLSNKSSSSPLSGVSSRSKGFYPYNPMNHPPPSYTKNSSPTSLSSTPTYTTIPIHTNGTSSQR